MHRCNICRHCTSLSLWRESLTKRWSSQFTRNATVQPFSYSDKLWVVTERIKLQIQAAEMSQKEIAWSAQSSGRVSEQSCCSTTLSSGQDDFQTSPRGKLFHVPPEGGLEADRNRRHYCISLSWSGSAKVFPWRAEGGDWGEGGLGIFCLGIQAQNKQRTNWRMDGRII